MLIKINIYITCRTIGESNYDFAIATHVYRARVPGRGCKNPKSLNLRKPRPWLSSQGSELLVAAEE